MARTSTSLATMIIAALCACTSGTPEVAVDAELVDFGAVEIGEVAQRTVTFTNSGSGAAALRGLQVIGGGEQFAVDSAFSAIDLPEAGSLTLVVTFRPTALGQQTAELTLNAADGSRSIALRGDGVAHLATGPRMRVLPQAIDFGESPPGAERRVFVSNVGDSPLRLGRMVGDVWQSAAPALDGVDASAFEVRVPTDFERSPSVPPGASLEVTVRLVTSTVGIKQSVLHVWSDDPAHPESTVSVDAIVIPTPPCSWIVEPASVDLRSVDGSPVIRSFVIRALGNSEAEWCVIRDLKLAQASSPTFSLPGGPIAWAAIRRGERMRVEVQFAAQTHALFTGAVQFDVDGASPSLGRVTLTGRSGVDDCLMIAPAELDFGAVAQDCASRERAVTVYNVCHDPVAIDSVSFLPADAGFAVTQKPVLPKSLASGEQVVVKSAFRPVHIGQHFGKLLVVTGDALTYEVQVTGRGFAPPLVSDVYCQDTPPKLDALFVIDESPSMADKQQTIATKLGAVIDYWDAHCLDYQVAVTTTSVDAAHGGAGTGTSIANGRFLPLDGSRTRIVSNGMADHRQLILQNAAVGTSGTTPEYLFRPAFLALSPPLLTGENAGFVRADAALFVMVISDSADHDTTPVSDYASFLQALKPNPRFPAWVDAAVPTAQQPAAGCSYGEADASLSTRMTDLAARTDGSTADICGQGWLMWGFLDNHCPRSRFFLSGLPSDPQLIHVDLDGQPYSAVGPNLEVRWRYNSLANSIDFQKAAYVPPSGSTLTVRYAAGECLP